VPLAKVAEIVAAVAVILPSTAASSAMCCSGDAASGAMVRIYWL
jgi:hypothetical protein